MDVLLTWVGSRDPGWENPRTGTFTPGPILSLLSSRHFDVVYLLFNLESKTEDFRQRANAVLRYCQKNLPRVEIKHRPVDVVSVTDYRELYRLVNLESQAILREEGMLNRNYFVYLSPGTPQMQTIWMLLVQSGLLEATMIDTTPREFLAPGAPIWRTVDLSLPDFPKILTPGAAAETLGVLEAQVDNLQSENRRLRAELELCRQDGRAEGGQSLVDGIKLREVLRDQEAAYYRLALEQAGGNAAKAARLLGVEPHTFRARAVNLNIRSRRAPRGDREHIKQQNA